MKYPPGTDIGIGMQRDLARKERELELREGVSGSSGVGDLDSADFDSLDASMWEVGSSTGGMSDRNVGSNRGVGGHKKKQSALVRRRRGDASLINPNQRKIAKAGPLGPPRSSARGGR